MPTNNNATIPLSNNFILNMSESGYSLSYGTNLATSNCVNSISDEKSALTKTDTKEKMPSKKAKTWLVTKEYDKGNLYVKIGDKDGFVDRTVRVMPDVRHLEVIENNGEKRVVFVTFSDGTTEKAVLDSDDTFSLEQAVSICISKKLFSMIVGKENGSSVYNKIVERCLKMYAAQQKEEEAAVRKTAEQKAKYLKLIEKKRNKRIRQENEAREELINIQKEAFIRAMKEINSTSCDVSAD